MHPDTARQVYITGLGTFLPGDPVANQEMEDFLGRIHGAPSRARARVLKRNGIQARHYAIDREQRTLHRNSEMAARAVRRALELAGRELATVDFLAAATTQADLPVPGFASMVHSELGSGPLEVATLHGVCSSGVAALQASYLQVRAGQRRAAVACASELPSRLFKASRYEAQDLDGGALPFDTEFLRWMLSDGAGAAVLEPEPASEGLSLRLDWIELRSHAGELGVCMYAGANSDADGRLGPSWLDYASFEAAARAGALNLKQDVRRIAELVPLGVDAFVELCERRGLHPDDLDWMVCHYSSELFRSQIFEALRRAGVEPRDERWFSNLATRGNVGSASAYLLLEGLLDSRRLEPGQRILLMVPESGGMILAFAHLTVVEEPVAARALPRTSRGPELASDPEDAAQGGLARELAGVWERFEGELLEVPIVDRLLGGRFSLEDYRALLFHLRQQVVDGARWIARAASSLEGDALELRSLVLGHAVDEHRDYELLERDYAGVGGRLEDIRAGEKNVGGEALSAWMLHEAGRPNPLGLLGAMFIIEGLGQVMATRFATAIREQLGLREDQVSFLAYHGANDDAHLGKLRAVLGSGLITPEVAARIVKTARVTARLYLLQLEEIDR